VDFDGRCIKYVREGEVRNVKFSNEEVDFEATKVEQVEGGLKTCNSLCHKSKAFTETHSFVVKPFTDVQVACKQSQCCNSSTAAFTDLGV
jgi:hypothetical protein